MTKKLSNTQQISLLKRLRRACPFAVWSGLYGYTCGGMVGGGYVLLLAWRHVPRRLATVCSLASTCGRQLSHKASTSPFQLTR